MNVGIFSGRLGRDAELNRMSTGDSVCNFPLAIDIGTRDNPKTMWVECALFGKRADSLKQYLLKGIKVTASGRVTLENYTGKDGAQKSAMRLNVTDIDMHLPPRDQATNTAPARTAAPAAKGSGFDDMDNDLPF